MLMEEMAKTERSKNEGDNSDIKANLDSSSQHLDTSQLDLNRLTPVTTSGPAIVHQRTRY